MRQPLLASALAGLLSWFCLTALAGNALPDSVEQALAHASIPVTAVAVVTQAVDSQTPSLRHRGDVALNPASLMKLVTTLAALETLGPGHVFRTEALASVAPENGILNGDLILRGSGDPRLTYDRLWRLLRELRGRGVSEIRGDLVLDRTAFAPLSHDPAAFDQQPLRPYNVGADALLFNFATLHLTLIPEATTVRVLAEPQPAGQTLVNRLRLTNGPCRSTWREALTAGLTPERIELSGDYPRACEEKRWNLAGLANDTLLHGVFTQLWRELGGRFAGRVRDASTPDNAQLLAFSESPPLAELVRDINKFSNNVMARQVFLKVGAGATATAEQAIRTWLARRGLDFPELMIDNGAGLSRSARISADSLARLLAAGWDSPVMPEFIASLPIAAIDGTTKKKFNGNGFAGQAHLKTGSLDGVRGIAGYLRDRQGRRHLIVFMVNHPNAGQAQAAFDALLEWLWSVPNLPASR
jgi:D-alanyl-D-alanine carboxypeptidase/D-alanyl-D-alanine-endopeptidase (penicillin-binding protein 4)